VISESDYAFLRESLIEDSRRDFVGLWVIPHWINSIAPEAGPDEVKSTTLRLVSELLLEGLIRAGHPSDSGRDFVEWKLPTTDILDQIESAWTKMNRTPNIGEVVIR
jgi:hypothetical protein